MHVGEEELVVLVGGLPLAVVFVEHQESFKSLLYTCLALWAPVLGSSTAGFLVCNPAWVAVEAHPGLSLGHAALRP